MTGAGFTISGDNHPISPVMLGDAKLASDFADAMLQEGIYVIGKNSFNWIGFCHILIFILLEDAIM